MITAMALSPQSYKGEDKDLEITRHMTSGRFCSELLENVDGILDPRVAWQSMQEIQSAWRYDIRRQAHIDNG